MYYSDELIEKLCKRSDIKTVCSKYTKFTWKNGAFYGICPFHKEKEPSFSLNQKEQTFHCYGCGAGGNVITFKMMVDNCSFEEAVEKLADEAWMKIPKPEKLVQEKIDENVKKRIIGINKAAARFFFFNLSEENCKGADYFKKRNLSNETVCRFGLGYSKEYGDSLIKYLVKKGYTEKEICKAGLAGEKTQKNKVTGQDETVYYDKFWNRAMFPIVNEDDQVVGFGGRVLDNSKPKYLNSAETAVFNKSHLLYGMNLAKNTKKSYFILCEGNVDVITLHQADFDSAVASLGTSLTEGQVAMIKKYTDNVYVSYDSDEPGVLAAVRAIEMLSKVGINVKVVNMNPYKDPDEFINKLGKDEYQKRIDEAEDSGHFLIRNLKKNNEPQEFYEKAANMLIEMI